MDETHRATHIRSRAQALREQGHKLKARAESLPHGPMRDMLSGQAAILTEGAADLEDRALEMMPTVGTA